MTSKAERARKKRAARKVEHKSAMTAVTAFPAEAPFQVSAYAQSDIIGECRRERVKTKQEYAWSWFFALRTEVTEGGPNKAGAREQLAAIRLHLTDDEYNIMCALCRPVAYVGRRVGRSADTVRALEMSALRKLVIYRSMNEIGGDE